MSHQFPQKSIIISNQIRLENNHLKFISTLLRRFLDMPLTPALIFQQIIHNIQLLRQFNL